MDKIEFREALRRNDLTCDEFSALIGRSLSQVYTWGGSYPVPYFARVVLTLLDERGGCWGIYPNKPRREPIAISNGNNKRTSGNR